VVKGPGREFNHSLSSTADVKNEWGIPLLPLYAVMAWTEKTLNFKPPKFSIHEAMYPYVFMIYGVTLIYLVTDSMKIISEHDFITNLPRHW